MSLDTIGTSYFGCAETPVWIPNGFDVNKIPDCASCKLRLVSPVPGSGNVAPRADGLLVDENPIATLSVNGIQHNLVETVLLIGGAHVLPGRTEPCKAELTCYFQSTKDFSVHVCLSLPVDIGTGTAGPYFQTLGTLKAGRPTLSTIVPKDATFLLYRGADLRGRSAGNNYPASFCDPVKRVTAYYVCLTPIFMTNADYTRLVARSGAGLKGPAKPMTPVVASRLVSLTSRVKGIALSAPAPHSVGDAPSGPGYPTKAMKCYRLKPGQDIVKDKVFVGGKGATTLEKELKTETEETSGGFLPGDLQRWLSASLGLGLAILLASFLFVFIFSSVFTNYKEAQHLYDNPLSAAGLSDRILPKDWSFWPTSLFGSKSCPEPSVPAPVIPSAQV